MEVSQLIFEKHSHSTTKKQFVSSYKCEYNGYEIFRHGICGRNSLGLPTKKEKTFYSIGLNGPELNKNQLQNILDEIPCTT